MNIKARVNTGTITGKEVGVSDGLGVRIVAPSDPVKELARLRLLGRATGRYLNAEAGSTYKQSAYKRMSEAHEAWTDIRTE